MKSRTLGNPDMPYSDLEFPVIASIKYDGRWTEVRVGESITYETSGGKQFVLEDNYPFDRLPQGVYFAEMMGEGIEGKLGDRVHSAIQTTFFTNTTKGIPNTAKPAWRIFNYVDFKDYRKGRGTHSYEIILQSLLEEVNRSLDSGRCIVDFKYCDTMEELLAFYEEVIEAGWEGLMVAQPSLKWEDSEKRLKTLVKMKEVPTIKAQVISTHEGEGKYAGLIGSLIVKTKEGVVFKVGSGLSDEDRELSTHLVIGRIAEIAYEQLIKGVPQQPRFKAFRESW